MNWYKDGPDGTGDVDLGGGLGMHEVLETDAFGNTATYTPVDNGTPETITGTLEQSTQRPDEILPEIAMYLTGQVFRVRRAIKREADFARSSTTDSMFYGQLDVAGTVYDIAGVSEDQSFVYLHLATAV